MKNLILVFIFISSVSLSAQDKYFIFFADKGAAAGSVLSKNSPLYHESVAALSERAVERRKKVMDDDLIKFEDLPLNSSYISQIENLGIKIHNKLKWFNAVSAYLTSDQISVLKSLSFVKLVEKVKIFRSENISTAVDNLFSKISADYGPSLNQYALSGIPALHEQNIAGEGVIIGLLDSGFDWRDHEALVNTNVIAEHDFVFNDDTTANQAEDSPSQHDHGTTVFSVVGGYKEGSIIAPSYKAAYILAKTEIVTVEKHVEEDNYAAALEWMENLGVDITSSSLGYSNGFDSGEGDYTYADMDGKSTIVTRAAELAFERGVLTISSAGNEGNQKFHFISAPSDGINTISVGAVNMQNSVAAFSSRGPSYDGRVKPDVVALGVSVYGASSSGFSQYRFADGTSLACPIISGIAGQILSVFPSLTNVELRKILLQSGDTFFSPDSFRGYGLVSATNAIYSSAYYPIMLNASTGVKRFSSTQIKEGSVKLHYTLKNKTSTVSLSANEDKSYNFTFTGASSGSSIQFYFTYNDLNDSTFREPEMGKLYNYKIGEEWVKYFTAADEGYTLSNNFPNPFNYETKTQIRFTAKGGEKAELVIIDGIGQKVKMLFNGIARPGVNEVTWDGYSDDQSPCASGVYFYFLKIAGKDFGKKMLLLK